MIGWLFQHLLQLRNIARTGDTPRQLAWGFALGVLLGILPKGNLVAVILTAVILATRANLGVGILTAVFFSFAAPVADPITHRIGLAVLTHDTLGPPWSRLFDWPLLPWTALNNTVVMGSLILGLALVYPSYRVSRPLFAHYRG